MLIFRLMEQYFRLKQKKLTKNDEGKIRANALQFILNIIWPRKFWLNTVCSTFSYRIFNCSPKFVINFFILWLFLLFWTDISILGSSSLCSSMSYACVACERLTSTHKLAHFTSHPVKREQWIISLSRADPVEMAQLRRRIEVVHIGMEWRILYSKFLKWNSTCVLSFKK